MNIICKRCGQSMTADLGLSYSHGIENEIGNTEAEYWCEWYRCPSGHVAVAWYVDDPPSDDVDNLMFDGQIDYLSDEGNTMFQEFRER